MLAMPPSISVALCTCDGTWLLLEQFDSGARQTCSSDQVGTRTKQKGKSKKAEGRSQSRVERRIFCPETSFHLLNRARAGTLPLVERWARTVPFRACAEVAAETRNFAGAIAA